MTLPSAWAPRRERAFALIARNASARYAALVIDMAIGLLLLPFNLAHLGAAEYGLWVLLGSLTIHFTVFDLGFSGALVKFVAQYRATANARALNEIASTMFFTFAAIGALAYLAVVVAAFNLGRIFNLTPEHVQIGMPVGKHVDVNLPLLDLVYSRQLSLHGMRGLGASGFASLLEMAASGQLDLTQLVTERLPLEGLQGALERMEAGSATGIAVIDRF